MNSAARRVMITGLGVVSSLGDDISAFWSALLYQPSQPVTLDRGPVEPQHMENRLFYAVGDTHAMRAGRATDFARRAAQAACRDAQLSASQLFGAGVIVGNAAGVADEGEQLRAAESDSGAELAELKDTYRVAAEVAEALSATGPNLSVSNACSAGAYSVSMAADLIQSGDADVVVAGGAEGFSRVTQACFNRLWALDTQGCRPFDRQRAGTVLGEGAAMLVLESEAHARARGRRPYGEIKGYAWSCDGHHATAPSPSGRRIEAVLRRTLRHAGLSAAEISCVLPHGTGTRLNDAIEAKTLQRVFGARLAKLPCSAIKSKLGHASGAAGAFSCVVASLITAHGVVPPTANLVEADRECGLRLHRHEPLRGRFNNVLVNAYGFGGNNVSLIVGAA